MEKPGLAKRQIGRYVNDVLCLWTGTSRQLNLFSQFLNSLHSKIQFTAEIETNGCLNFLDLSISISQNKHFFSIFRKPCYTDCIIHSDSRHPFLQKLAAFHAMTDRLLRIPEEDYSREFQVISTLPVSTAWLTNSYIEKGGRKPSTAFTP
ncbi:hypothetical protein J437_LFUL001940 [Ladona fulva]|uniref:Uncharacterized protein n=1 Tax=Ladona fulva TaxID=123851 RepID=A0A8K0JZ19_LADFU|nr:hypothetical protein J437_LFUL001940 [Ladona fulva]